MKKKLPKVCVIVFPSNWLTNRLFLSDLAYILEPITKRLYLISGNLPKEIFNKNVRLIDIGSPPRYKNSMFGIIISAMYMLFIQIKMSLRLLRISKDVDLVIFYLSYFYQLPLFTAKILGKKTMLIQGNSISSTAISKSAMNPITTKISPLLINFNCSLANYIVPKAKRLACEYSNYSDKVLLHGARFVDLDLFKMKTPINQRKNIVGYIGRLSLEKGIMNFVNAIPLVLSTRDDIKFIIKGDGPLLEKIKEILRNYPRHVTSSIKWVPHEELPDYLNKMKLFVLPSFVETTPQIIQEAMACGTPVLASPVGDIPDIVIDSKTGFILKNNNSPEIIARDIIQALNYKNLDKIVINATKLIEKEYSYEAAVKRYKRILEKVETGANI